MIKDTRRCLAVNCIVRTGNKCFCKWWEIEMIGV